MEFGVWFGGNTNADAAGEPLSVVVSPGGCCIASSSSSSSSAPGVLLSSMEELVMSEFVVAVDRLESSEAVGGGCCAVVVAGFFAGCGNEWYRGSSAGVSIKDNLDLSEFSLGSSSMLVITSDDKSLMDRPC